MPLVYSVHLIVNVLVMDKCRCVVFLLLLGFSYYHEHICLAVIYILTASMSLFDVRDRDGEALC